MSYQTPFLGKDFGTSVVLIIFHFISSLKFHFYRMNILLTKAGLYSKINWATVRKELKRLD